MISLFNSCPRLRICLSSKYFGSFPLGSKITSVTTAMKLRHLLLGRKVMTNLDSILKSRDITLLTKVHLVKPMVFPVVMYGCESWTIKKAEHWRIDAFWTVVFWFLFLEKKYVVLKTTYWVLEVLIVTGLSLEPSRRLKKYIHVY